MKIFNWKRLGIGLAAVWLIVLVAGVGAIIYQNMDGGGMRLVLALNLTLQTKICELTGDSWNLERADF